MARLDASEAPLWLSPKRRRVAERRRAPGIHVTATSFGGTRSVPMMATSSLRVPYRMLFWLFNRRKSPMPQRAAPVICLALGTFALTATIACSEKKYTPNPHASTDSGASEERPSEKLPASPPAVAHSGDHQAAVPPSGAVAADSAAPAPRRMKDEFTDIEIDDPWADVVAGKSSIWDGGALMALRGQDSAILAVGCAQTKGTLDRAALSRAKDAAKTVAMGELVKLLSSNVTSWSKRRSSTVKVSERAKQDTTISHAESAAAKASYHVEAYVDDDKHKGGVQADAGTSIDFKDDTHIDHALEVTKEIFELTEFTSVDAERRLRGTTVIGSWRAKDGSALYVAVLVTRAAVKAAEEFGQ